MSRLTLWELSCVTWTQILTVRLEGPTDVLAVTSRDSQESRLTMGVSDCEQP
jgi:hypothetical protein